MHAMLEKRDDNWLIAAGRAMLLSLAVVASTVVVVSCMFFALGAGREGPHEHSSVTHCLVTNDGQNAVALWWNVPVTLRGWTHRLTLHGPGTQRPTTTLTWPGITPYCIAPAARGDAIFIGDWNGSLYQLDNLAQASLPRLIGQHRESVTALQASADGRHLVSLSPRAICAWDLPAQQLRWQFEASHVSAIRIHPDSSRLLCGMDDGRVLEIDLITGERMGSLLRHPPRWPVYDLDVTTDGKRVCVVHSTGEAWIVSGEPGESRVAETPFCHVGWPRYARFSPCGELLVTTAEAEKPVLRVWSLERRTSLRELRGHTSIILGASFAADGRLFSWGQDGSIRVWDALEGRMLQVIALSASAQLVEGAPPAVWRRATTHDAHRIERSPPS